MEIRVAQSKEAWEEFLHSTKYGKFQNSWEWGEFQASLGKVTVRLEAVEKGEVVAVALATVEADRFGDYVYVPRGPVLRNYETHIFPLVLEELEKYFISKFNPTFIKYDPAVDPDYVEIFKRLGFKSAVRQMQVECAWVNEYHELLPDAEKYLADDMLLIAALKQHGMGSRRVGDMKDIVKSGVMVEFCEKDDIETISAFYDIFYNFMIQKSNVPRTKEYMIAMLQQNSSMNLCVARHEGEVLGGYIFGTYNDEVSSLYVAQNELGKKMKVTTAFYLASYKAMLEKRIGRYNFWGVNKEENMNPSRPGYGYSLYKMDFGGNRELYIRAQDFPVKKLRYYASRLLEMYRDYRFKTD